MTTEAWPAADIAIPIMDFELAALMLFRSDSYAPALAVLVPVSVIRAYGEHRKHVNGDVVFIRPPLTTAPEVIDVTAEVLAAHAGIDAVEVDEHP